MYSFFKRCFDLLSALSLFIVICPLFLFLMCLVWFDLGSPVFFTQVRSGKGMKPFKLIKFRSMMETKDENGRLLNDEQRVTALGRALRSSSLDELPELMNIIKGDMSVIGPRSLPPLYDAYFRPDEKDRFRVRGGLIPPDSIDSDPIISWDKQFEYESDYGRNLSFKKDLQIFFAVFRMLFKRKNIDYGSYERPALSEERKNMII